MIRRFFSRDTELVWQGLRSRRLPPDVQRQALRKLLYLNRARILGDLRQPPGSQLEALKRDRGSPQWSIRINDQWRICFKWENENAEAVEIVDCH